MKRYILHREYPDLNVDDLKVTLIEGTDRLLRTMSESASREALEYLGHLMVDVKLEKTMKSYKDNIITLADGEEIYSEMAIWTAGITGEPFNFEGATPEMEESLRFDNRARQYEKFMLSDPVFLFSGWQEAKK